MIALPESKKLICPSCGGSALSYASDAANLLEKHRRLGNADAARRAERSMLHYWQAAIDYSGHDRAFQARLAGSLRAYRRTQTLPDFKALQWGVRRELIIPPRGTRIENKAWIKNGKVLMRNGKVLLCDECPCGDPDPENPGLSCAFGGTACIGGVVPQYVKQTYPNGWTKGSACSNRCANLNGLMIYWEHTGNTTGSCCNYSVAKVSLSSGVEWTECDIPGQSGGPCDDPDCGPFFGVLSTPGICGSGATAGWGLRYARSLAYTFTGNPIDCLQLDIDADLFPPVFPDACTAPSGATTRLQAVPFIP